MYKEWNRDCSALRTLVLDFDGTISEKEICDAVMAEFNENWMTIGRRHDNGDISHAELNRQFLDSLTASPNEIKDFMKGEDFKITNGFKKIIDWAMQNNVVVFFVSGGWDFYITELLSKAELDFDIKLIDKVADFDPHKVNLMCNSVAFNGLSWTVTSQHKGSFLSCPCKHSIMAEIRQLIQGKIAFVGDGSTDFDAAKQADIVFARDRLATFCEQNKLSYLKFDNFNTVKTVLSDYSQKDNENGYLDKLNIMRSRYFLQPNGSNVQEVEKSLISGLQGVLEHQGKGPTFPYLSKRKTSLETICDAQIDTALNNNPAQFLYQNLAHNLQGGVKAGHPLMVKNIIAVPSSIYLAAHYTASFYAQNGVTGEDSAEALNAELKVAAVLSEMAGLDKRKSAGLFTFGGTGTIMYGIKMGLSKCYQSYGLEGLKEGAYTVGSKPAHYCHVTAMDWLGLGQNNYIHAASHTDQTTDLVDLEKKCREVLGAGNKLASIIGLGGSTSNMAIDDFAEIMRIRDQLVQDYSLDYSPHIHADSVLGWVYLYFLDYDFRENNLAFSPAVVTRLEAIVAKLRHLKYADSFGVDFHKTGYIPYNSSMVICKDKDDIKVLGRDSALMTPLFHDDSVYNPGKVTLETSRSSANMLATWMTMQTFGKEGYRILLGHAQEMAAQARKEIENYADAGLRIVNNDGFGTDIFIRCYPSGTDVEQEYAEDLRNDDSLKLYSSYTSDFFKWLTISNDYAQSKFAISKTSAAFYTKSGKPMVALRLYILSPYTSPQSVHNLISDLVEAKRTYDYGIRQAHDNVVLAKHDNVVLAKVAQDRDVK